MYAHNGVNLCMCVCRYMHACKQENVLKRLLGKAMLIPEKGSNGSGAQTIGIVGWEAHRAPKVSEMMTGTEVPKA